MQYSALISFFQDTEESQDQQQEIFFGIYSRRGRGHCKYGNCNVYVKSEQGRNAELFSGSRSNNAVEFLPEFISAMLIVPFLTIGVSRGAKISIAGE